MPRRTPSPGCSDPCSLTFAERGPQGPAPGHSTCYAVRSRSCPALLSFEVSAFNLMAESP